MESDWLVCIIDIVDPQTQEVKAFLDWVDVFIAIHLVIQKWYIFLRRQWRGPGPGVGKCRFSDEWPKTQGDTEYYRAERLLNTISENIQISGH